MGHIRHYGKSRYLNAIREMTKRCNETPALPSKVDDITLIAIDECTEMTTQDLEKLRDHSVLTGCDESIQTEKSSSWLRYIAAGRGSKASMASAIPANDEEGGDHDHDCH
jgi:hypothetical protein